MPRADVLRLLHGIWAADYEEWDAERDVTVTRFGAGIHLALDAPHLLLPVNAPPAEPHVLLPLGSTIQVHDTATHLDRLATISAADGERWVYATLHKVTEQLPRSRRDVLEVRVDGARVGKETPKMSRDVLPAVVYLTVDALPPRAYLCLAGRRAVGRTIPGPGGRGNARRSGRAWGRPGRSRARIPLLPRNSKRSFWPTVGRAGRASWSVRTTRWSGRIPRCRPGSASSPGAGRRPPGPSRVVGRAGEVGAGSASGSRGGPPRRPSSGRTSTRRGPSATGMIAILLPPSGVAPVAWRWPSASGQIQTSVQAGGIASDLDPRQMHPASRSGPPLTPRYAKHLPPAIREKPGPVVD